MPCNVVYVNYTKYITIFIPFVGSGSEIISAIRNNRKAFGCEINKEYCNFAKDRVNMLLKRA
ncbi:DNA methyltransferase [Campylobacter coli]|uniref:DNA methyltransferase n=1 Tax=Campylobacter jejuni TaxID=197 RepID=UPI003364D175